jgi:CubicO group peptidase (beta-lactamase class C family)
MVQVVLDAHVVSDGRPPTITVNQLLTHTAGLTHTFRRTLSPSAYFQRARPAKAWVLESICGH